MTRMIYTKVGIVTDQQNTLSCVVLWGTVEYNERDYISYYVRGRRDEQSFQPSGYINEIAP